MARKLLMTWVPGGRRWTKKYRGRMYAVSCKQLGCPDTKEGSAQAANDKFGLLEVVNGRLGGDFGPVVGLRTSHDKSFPAGLAVGARVLL